MRLSFVLAAMLIASSLAAETANKPPVQTTAKPPMPSTAKPLVPRGVDPGGILITLVGPGVDYTDSKIAARLARDGEGELIGWDLADNDRKPYLPKDSRRSYFSDHDKPPYEMGGYFEAESILANLIVSQSAAGRLAVFRAEIGNDPSLLIKALAMAVTKPPAILVFPWRSLDFARGIFNPIIAQRLKDTLVIIGAPHEALPKSLNVLAINGFRYDPTGPRSDFNCDNFAELATDSPGSQRSKRYVTDETGLSEKSLADTRSKDTAESVAQIAALAARILAAEPNLKGPELKARILELSEPLPTGYEYCSNNGWIPDPSSLYVLLKPLKLLQMSFDPEANLPEPLWLRHYPLPAAKP